MAIRIGRPSSVEPNCHQTPITPRSRLDRVNNVLTQHIYVAFVIDAYARRILGWRSAGHMRTRLVLDALEHALWTRQQTGRTVEPGLLCHSDAGSQYVAVTTKRHAEAGSVPSVGTVGDAYDNAQAETTIGLSKTELFKPRGPWRTPEQVEIAVLEWVDWYNHRRLDEHCSNIPPVEFEDAHYRQQPDVAEAGSSMNRVSGHAGAVHSSWPRVRDNKPLCTKCARQAASCKPTDSPQ